LNRERCGGVLSAARVHLDAGCTNTLKSINFSAFNRFRLNSDQSNRSAAGLPQRA
jgi:hypothetical protein